MSEYADQARRFNEDAAPLRVYAQKRARRRSSILPEELLDSLDWEAAKRECGRVLRPGQMLYPSPL